MNVKKQLLLLVALVVLLIGAASATDVSNGTIGSDTSESIAEDTSSPEEVAVEEKSTPTMDVEKNTAEQKINKITRDKKSLKTASSYDVETYQELCDALTNINDEYITVNIKDNIKLEDYILIESNRSVAPCIYVTINGEGNTIDGDHQHYFLNIAQNVMVTINNLTVNNCTAAPSLVDGSQLTAGGAIINRDTLILNNTRFNNNHAELYGGAIWNYDTLIVDNSEFNNNTAYVDNLSADGVGLGGAIYGGSLIVNKTRFNNNRAYTGGAISVNRYLIVDNTEFNNNTAESAGAIHTSCTSTLTNTVFNNNVADSYGGAISNGGTLTVNNTQFNNNTVHGIYMEDEIFGWMMSGGGGGAISNGGTGNLTVTDTEFNNNHADNYGGAIDTTAYSNLTVTNSRFNCNTADWWGGAIYYLNASESAGLGEFHPHGIGSYNIADTTFYKNTPANFIIDQDNYIELKENDNYINVSNIAIIVDGEEIYNAPTYEYAGGEFDMIAYCEIPEGNHLVKLIVNGTNIINNEYILSDTIDVTYQGLIDVIEGATMDITLKLEEGLQYDILETITLDKPGITITIDGNGQTINGMQNQVFHINSGSSLVLKNITITNAEAEDGGAIYNEGNLTIIDSTLINNQATSGGAIYNSYGKLTITDTTLNNNTAKDGGAIRTLYGSVTITGSTLNNNQATTTATGEFTYVDALGGAIINLYGNVTITDSTLNSNQATSTSTGNHNVGAHARGGAIYNTGTLTITDTTLNSNQATATASSTGEFRTVEAYAYGGAILNSYGNLTITDSTLENNQVMATATGFDAIVDVNALGGAIYNNKRNYNITGTSFYNNAPANIIINDSKRIEVIEEEDSFVSIGKFTIIADGKEIGTGTGIDNLTQFSIGDEYKNVEIVINGTDGKTLNNRYILRGFSVEVHNYTELVEAMEKAQNDNYNSYIINLLPGYYNATKSITWEESETKNLIINGNGLTLDGNNTYQFIKIASDNNLTLNNLTITNYTSDSGGAIYNSGTLSITDSTLTNNIAKHAGAIYNVGTLSITDSSLNNNTATQYGGAIRNNYGTLSITHTTLSDNNALHAGAIWNYGTLTITDSTLINNTATYYAGAIYNSGTLTITDSTLANSTANIGGAIQNNYGRLNIINITLANNTANEKGGAISYIYQEVVTINEDPEYINVIDSNFIKNHAGEGGAIYSLGYANLTGNTFSENTADNKETIDLNGRQNGIFEDNQYISTDIFLNIELSIKDNMEIFETGEDVTLNFIIELEHPYYYDSDILERMEINKTLYVNGVENVTTNNTNYIISNLSPGKYTVNYITTNNYSNNVTFIVMGNSEIKTDKETYYYYDGIKDRVTLTVTDFSGEKGTADIYVKDGDRYLELVSCHNVRDVFALSTEILKEALEILYADDLGDSYNINVTYTGEYAHPSSTEFTLNIIKQRNTSIIYDIINNTEGNVQIYIIVLDDIYRTPVPDAAIKITGDIQQETTSGIITDTTLLPGDYTITVSYEENADYMASTETIDFTVEIDKDKKIEELEEQINQLTAAKNTTITLDPITDAKYNSNTTISGTLINEDSIGLFNQIVTLNIGDKTVNVTTKGGIFEYTTSFKTMEEQTITAVYAGTDKYQASNDTITFTIAKQDVIITVEPIADVAYGENVTITGTFTTADYRALRNSNIVIYVNEVHCTVKTDDRGVFRYEYKATLVGKNNLTVTYRGNAKYNAAEAIATFTVDKKDTVISIDEIAEVKYLDVISITGTFKNADGSALKNSNVVLYINGEHCTVKTDSNGVFTYEFKASVMGENNLTVTYRGNAKYNGAEAVATFTVDKKDTVLTVDPVADANKGDPVTVKGTFKNSDGTAFRNSNVVVYVNGAHHTVKTDSKGNYNYTFTAKLVGQNDVRVVFNGNAKYNACETVTVFKVKE